MKIINILNELAATSSRLEKEAILRKHKNNLDLQKTVKMALDTLTQFHIRKIPAYTPNPKGQDPLHVALSGLALLENRTFTGNAAIAYLKELLENVKPEDALVIERVIAKDLRCGVQTSTANKIWPKLCHEFPCMLASPFDEKLIKKVDWPVLIQEKLDGMRCTMIFDLKSRTVSAYSRNGKEIDFGGRFDDVVARTLKNLEELYEGEGYTVFDGELMCFDSSTQKWMDRKTGNGILNKAIKNTITKEELETIRFVLFDNLKEEEFREGKSVFGYEQRFLPLEDCVPQDNGLITLAEWQWAFNEYEVLDIFKGYINRGSEGIILKERNGKWEDKRSKNLIKYKAEEDCDLLCVGWEEGSGKYKGMLGALVLESADKKLRVSVGTGFTDEDRATIREKDVLDKIIAVRYNMKVNDKTTGMHSLFLPRFVEIRSDKTKADKFKDIK